jgi:hypothetical protein
MPMYECTAKIVVSLERNAISSACKEIDTGLYLIHFAETLLAKYVRSVTRTSQNQERTVL